MKKTDLIDALAAKMDDSKAAAERTLTTVLDTIQEGLLSDGVVQITGFGTFKIRSRGPRMGRNPRTGEPVQLAGSKSVGFKVGKALKDSIQ
jgi:nucleoid DNA-binding protein